jgi:hypothetical protein
MRSAPNGKTENDLVAGRHMPSGRWSGRVQVYLTSAAQKKTLSAAYALNGAVPYSNCGVKAASTPGPTGANTPARGDAFWLTDIAAAGENSALPSRRFHSDRSSADTVRDDACESDEPEIADWRALRHLPYA